jgi:hypothetical protein
VVRGLQGWCTNRHILRIKTSTLLACVFLFSRNLLSFGLFCTFNISTTKVYMSANRCPIDLWGNYSSRRLMKNTKCHIVIDCLYDRSQVSKFLPATSLEHSIIYQKLREM